LPAPFLLLQRVHGGTLAVLGLARAEKVLQLALATVADHTAAIAVDVLSARAVVKAVLALHPGILAGGGDRQDVGSGCHDFIIRYYVVSVNN
jgi:hypothetical protein